MDVDGLVTKWVPIIRGLAVGHTKDEIDRCEFESETYLTPLIAAPVKQLREFFSQLTAALKADPQIPLFVWTVFEQYQREIVQKAKDEEIKELKGDLAKQIADMVEKEIQPDLSEAIAAALRWRGEKQLQELKGELEKGAKPRLRGRESCLFLEAGSALVMV